MIENIGNVGAIRQSRAFAGERPNANLATAIPIIIIVSIIINGFLFIGSSLLSKLDRIWQPPTDASDSIVHYRVPPKPPEARLEEVEEIPKPPPPPKSIKPDISSPAINLERLDLGIGTSADATVSVPLPTRRIAAPSFGGKLVHELDEVDRQPRLVKRLPPLYPFEAKRKKIQGKVIIKVIVNKEGKATEPVVLESHPKGVFEAAALRAVKRWRFRPATKGGNPVDVYVVLPILFELAG